MNNLHFFLQNNFRERARLDPRDFLTVSQLPFAYGLTYMAIFSTKLGAKLEGQLKSDGSWLNTFGVCKSGESIWLEFVMPSKFGVLVFKYRQR